ncbi:tyrosine-type recombinase/integrase [Dactylosporangium sp. CA-052675]|uniref:tyrosine-type recombinase/integrase n=1 Tax=Dactylosporangium sp. CA-052675 TaxID=3239927 RepID=UPI003D9141DF
MKKPHPWIERYRAHMVASGKFEEGTTITDRCELLYRLDAELPLGLLEATIEELENWMASGRTAARRGRRSAPWSRQTKATYFGHIVGFYGFASDPNRMPHLSYDPSASLSRPKVPSRDPQPCTTEDLERLLARARAPFLTYCILTAYAGLRPIQISNLDRENITEQHIYVAGKGGKVSTIPTHPAIWAAVRDFPRGPIATVTHRGQVFRATADYLSTCTSREIERALGHPGVTLRNVRHWYATTLLTEKELGGAGANLRTVQELMCHASVATTAIYTRVVGRQRDLAISALPSLAPTPN